MQINVELTDEQAWALAQFCKRSCWQHFRECATSDTEAEEQIAAVEQLRLALVVVGIEPR
jgi:hypothetical protein